MCKSTPLSLGASSFLLMLYVVGWIATGKRVNGFRTQIQGARARMILTESQRKAIEDDGRNLQLIACASSGKTEVARRGYRG